MCTVLYLLVCIQFASGLGYVAILYCITVYLLVCKQFTYGLGYNLLLYSICNVSLL
jgi:hypothetical protein